MLADIFDIKKVLYIFPIVSSWQDMIICLLLALAITNLFIVSRIYFRLKKEKQEKLKQKEDLIAVIKSLEIEDPNFYKKLNGEIKKFLEKRHVVEKSTSRTFTEIIEKVSEDKEMIELFTKINKTAFYPKNDSNEMRTKIKIGSIEVLERIN
ncbi:MAG: hypothetical protein PHO80_05030 [Candidatus Gracilibacteria bacterium]|nr:hypothetical protein [Candidatus Gracilibacteria bacterium]MDD4530880.1 hypothetical protein [Candidatus Gracilibacteria bacterium]